jgi:hypothetical protein
VVWLEAAVAHAASFGLATQSVTSFEYSERKNIELQVYHTWLCHTGWWVT